MKAHLEVLEGQKEPHFRQSELVLVPKSSTVRQKGGSHISKPTDRETWVRVNSVLLLLLFCLFPGVRQESVDAHRCVNICMEEIKRCQETSLGITFIAILGDKYGSRPLPPSVEAVEFEKLLQQLDQAGCDEVTSWYLRDDNSLPPCYVLKPISTEFPGINSKNKKETSDAKEKWWEVEEKICRHLRSAAKKAALDEKNRRKYIASITQLEIEKGVVTDPEASHRCLVIDRRFDHINEEDGKAKYFVNMKVRKFSGAKFLNFITKHPDRLTKS